MKKFFKRSRRNPNIVGVLRGKNKIFLAVIVGALIVGAGIYFSQASLDKVDKGKEAPSKCLTSPETIVTKVIDGDTVIVEGGYHIRLLGIDADERGYPCYEAAKEELEKLVLNRKVRLEKDKTDVDKYKRCLRYIFVGDENVDVELVKEGLAVARFYEPDIKYQKEIQKAEKEAIENKIGCKWSSSTKTELSFAKTTEDKTRKLEPQWQKLTRGKLGYNVVGACQAGKYLGKEIIVEGKVADTYRDSKSNTVFLNFEKAYPNQCFTGVIFNSDLFKFVQNPEYYYLNKTIRIMGKVREYKGRPEIILEEPNQIEVGK